MPVTTVEPQALFDLRSRGQARELIDVRTPAEFETVHAAGARNIPLDRLDPRAVADAHSGSEPIYLICKGGTRSGQAAEKFIAAGFDRVVSVTGGTSAWEQAGLPVERGARRVIPLDRQTMIAAGSLVTIGMALGTFVNAGFYILSAFIGCGLIFAGATGFCGMALLLAKMPWNQSQSCTSCCGASTQSKKPEELATTTRVS